MNQSVEDLGKRDATRVVPPLAVASPASAAIIAGSDARYPKRLMLVLGLIGLLLAIALLAWGRIGPAPLSQIADTGIYRSAQPSPEDLARWIDQYGLRSLINLRGANPGADWYLTEQAVAARLQRWDIGLTSTKLPRRHQLIELLGQLTQLDRPLLVHCEQGRDRSGLAATMVQLSRENGRLDQAEAELPLLSHLIRRETVGRQLLDQYLAWLDRRGFAHSPSRFTDFVENGYVDARGNLDFDLGRINHQIIGRSESIQRIEVTSDRPLELAGWAFDPVAGGPLSAVEVGLGDLRLPARIAVPRPDVARAFQDPRRQDSGWTLGASLAGTEPGCRPLQLHFTRGDGSTYLSEPLATLCLEQGE